MEASSTWAEDKIICIQSMINDPDPSSVQQLRWFDRSSICTLNQKRSKSPPWQAPLVTYKRKRTGRIPVRSALFGGCTRRTASLSCTSTSIKHLCGNRFCQRASGICEAQKYPRIWASACFSHFIQNADTKLITFSNKNIFRALKKVWEQKTSNYHVLVNLPAFITGIKSKINK